MTSFGDWLHGKLSRVTRSGEIIKEIDGLRFVAIMAVVLFHIRPYVLTKAALSSLSSEMDFNIDFIISYGFIGVQLFFAISGFVLALPFARAAFANKTPPNLKEYFFRRLTRLEPPYFVNLILIFFLLIAFKGLSFFEGLPHFFSSLFYVHNLIYARRSIINTVTWSLEIEVQFYVLMPLLSYLFYITKMQIRLFAYLFLFLVAGFCSSYFLGPRGSLSLVGQFQFFLVGIVFADLFLNKFIESTVPSLTWDLWGILGWVCIIPTLSLQNKIPSKFIVPALILISYTSAFRGKYSNLIFRNRWIVLIGGMCYTIYLYHHFIMSFIGRYTVTLSQGHSFALSFIEQAALMVPVILLVCGFLFYFIEKPFMRRWWHPRNSADVTSPPIPGPK